MQLSVQNSISAYLKYACVFFAVEIGTLLSCGCLSLLVRYILIPTVSWQTALNFNFDTICHSGVQPINNMCNFPSTEFDLTLGGSSVFTHGHPYSIVSDLYVPDSPKNNLAGMNILTLELLDESGNCTRKFRKSFSVPYRSTLVRFTSRLLLLPLHVTRMAEEELHIFVELASGYQNYQASFFQVSSFSVSYIHSAPDLLKFPYFLLFTNQP
ncbi:hypothetical protein EG68_09153 [Paragonimus skrjabini miyazakii]|uniref:Seipin n=1 Tax=Paragonimus skrjabini miyazakii TaxID=59628 RepID=A0A8S9YHM1_9TREM|nr:hypothetical protein EG68_09153 [Paragonimus skrjabini miyazakii]